MIPVDIIIKDFSSLDSAANDMMKCPRGVYASFAWHTQSIKYLNSKKIAYYHDRPFMLPRLPYLLACGTFVHYMKCMIRDRMSSFNSLTDMQRFLNIWISKYVSGDTDTSEHVKARRPLAAAEVVLEEVKGSSDFVIARLYLHPHFQIEDPKVTLQLPVELPLPK
jgi:predicted component of type VI protein secretion system